MNANRLLNRTALLLASAALAFSLAACGSGSENEDAAGDGTGTPAGVTGTSGKQGEFKPEKKAPESAGDRKDAPDKGISDRPGGPGSPVEP